MAAPKAQFIADGRCVEQAFAVRGKFRIEFDGVRIDLEFTPVGQVKDDDARVGARVPYERDARAVGRPARTGGEVRSVGDAPGGGGLQVQQPKPAMGRKGEGAAVRRRRRVRGPCREDGEFVLFQVDVMIEIRELRVAVVPLGFCRPG